MGIWEYIPQDLWFFIYVLGIPFVLYHYLLATLKKTFSPLYQKQEQPIASAQLPELERQLSDQGPTVNFEYIEQVPLDTSKERIQRIDWVRVRISLIPFGLAVLTGVFLISIMIEGLGFGTWQALLGTEQDIWFTLAILLIGLSPPILLVAYNIWVERELAPDDMVILLLIYVCIPPILVLAKDDVEPLVAVLAWIPALVYGLSYMHMLKQVRVQLDKVPPKRLLVLRVFKRKSVLLKPALKQVIRYWTYAGPFLIFSDKHYFHSYLDYGNSTWRALFNKFMVFPFILCWWLILIIEIDFEATALFPIPITRSLIPESIYLLIIFSS